jgi:hypothetical protein
VWNSSVPVWSDEHQGERGLRYESFVLMESEHMFEFTTPAGLE